MNKRCPYCQTQNHEGAAYCAHCGRTLDGLRAGNFCSAGLHPIDPGWSTCPYCNAGSSAPRQMFVESPPGDETVDESFPVAAEPTPPPNPAGDPAALPRRTVFGGAGGNGPAAGDGTNRRPIVGLMVTYSWDPAGAVFPVREGRNLIGRDEGCEIRVVRDSLMSGRHAIILFRNREFWIDDEKSMNGTYVGSDCVLSKRPLADQELIKTGKTVWRFLAIPREEA